MTISITIRTNDDDSNGISDDLDALSRLAYREANDLISVLENQG